MKTNARKCRWCSRMPCPYEGEEAFRRQLEIGGRKWVEEKPCWVPIEDNIGVIYDREGNYLPGADPERI